MKTMFRLILLVIVLGGWALSALSLHVVRLHDSLYVIGIVPKNRLHWDDTYLDIRTWTAAEVHQHPDFVRRTIAAGKTDWLKHTVPDQAGDLEAQLLQILESGPPPAAPADEPSAPRGTPPIVPRHKGVR